MGALRATSSISYLISSLSKQRHFDFVFYDTGPNIGPLNRVLLLDSDFFIVPVACDLFSTRALFTLGRTVKQWITHAETIDAIAPDGAMMLKGKPEFLGYIPQRFKIYGQDMTLEASSYHRKIKNHVYEDISSVLRKVDKKLAPKRSINPLVGKVQDLASVVQVAQREGVPIWNCSAPNAKLKEAARKSFFHIAEHIVHAAAERI